MLIQSGILNPDGSKKIGLKRIPKLIGEGILPPDYVPYEQREQMQSGGLSTGTINVPGTNPGGMFVQPRRPDPFGNILPDQGFTPLPDPRFGTGVIPLPDPSQGMNRPQRPGFDFRFGVGPGPGFNLPPVPNELMQNQMFQPPMQPAMQPPVQNQMPVANSFLDQLQQSAGLLQNQVTALQPPVVNNVPQNRFVGNQFQMPFGMGQPTPLGGNYGSGGFGYNPGTYTPGAFNQYGDTSTTGGINDIINSLLGPGADRGGEGDAGGMFGGVQGQNDPSNPRNRQDRYDKNPDGSITQYDASTGLTTTYGLDDEGLTLAQKLFGNIAKVPTTASLVESAIGGLLGNLTDTGFSVNPNMPSNQLENPTNNPLITSYNQMITENIPGLPVSPINIPEVDLSLPTGLLTGVDQGPTNEFGRTRAEQDAVNASIEQGNFVGYGQNEEGNFAGVVTGGPNNSPVTTGFTNNTSNINNPAAVAAISANATPAQLGIVRPAIGTSGGGEGSGGGGGRSCFVKGTMLQMADGTKKEISTVELGDNTKGGIVEMTMQGLPQTIYNYKDVLVSGSHWVIEDNEFVAVEDSKHGVLTDKVEPVYTLKTSDHRMWINDIEFGDFETGSDNDWEPHFEMVRKKLNKELRDGK